MNLPFPWSELTLSDLPQSMFELAELIGLENTLLLLANCGESRRRYIPKKVNPPRKDRQDEHWIVDLVGEAAAAKIADKYGGDYIRFPNCAIPLTRIRVIALREEAKTHSAIARQLGLTTIGVARILSRAKEENCAAAIAC